MKLIIGSDHAAFQAKEKIVTFLKEKGYELIDVGTHSEASCHYPTYAIDLCRAVKKEKVLGILLCGSGIGVSMVANRFKGIRAALCRSHSDARLAREHNDANVLCLGARASTDTEMQEMIEIWLKTSFAGGRHCERISLFDQLGEE